jgi:hypothetical protein
MRFQPLTLKNPLPHFQGSSPRYFAFRREGFDVDWGLFDPHSQGWSRPARHSRKTIFALKPTMLFSLVKASIIFVASAS